MNHVMRWFLLVPTLVLVMSAYSQNPSPSRSGTAEPQQRQSNSAQQPISPGQPGQSNGSQQPTSPGQAGTEKMPIVVKVLPTPKTQEEASQEAKDRADKTVNDRKLVEFTRGLFLATFVLAAIGFFQLIVFGLQAHRLRQTVDAATKQSGAMERSITEANRLASTMEHVAKDMGISARAAIDSVAALKERTAQQMRAYLCIAVGTGFYQERAKNIKFQIAPLVINAGHTPAHKVSFRVSAALLSMPLPDDFSFPLPAASIGASVIGPQQSINVSPMVEDFCDDDEVDKIKAGNQDKALYGWGIITYEDVFGQPQQTKFCQILTWQPDGKIWGYFHTRHNEAT